MVSSPAKSGSSTSDTLETNTSKNFRAALRCQGCDFGVRKRFLTFLVGFSTRCFKVTGRAFCLILLLVSHLAAQDSGPVATKADQQVPQPVPKSPATHRFWDTPNAALFAGVA